MEIYLIDRSANRLGEVEVVEGGGVCSCLYCGIVHLHSMLQHLLFDKRDKSHIGSLFLCSRSTCPGALANQSYVSSIGCSIAGKSMIEAVGWHATTCAMHHGLQFLMWTHLHILTTHAPISVQP